MPGVRGRVVLTLSLCVVAAATAATAIGYAGGDDGVRAARDGRGARPAALTWQQELRVTDAQQRLMNRCMKRHGFTYWETGA